MTTATAAQFLECPFCDHTAERRLFGYHARPPGQEHDYAELYRCPRCRLWFAPLTTIVERANIGADS